MSDAYLLLIDRGAVFLGGFLIGIGLKTIIDAFAARDDSDRKFESIESRLDELEDELGDRLDDLEEQGDELAEVVDEHTTWIEEIESDDDETGEMLARPAATNE